jgi:CDP-glucose 4,6-dehydratase
MGFRQSALGCPVNFGDFYSHKKVLVTGHTGFKGGWLTVWLKLLGAEVVGLALPPETEPNLFYAARVADGIVSEIIDIRELAPVKAAFAKYKPEIVIHNAAQPLVRRSYRDPVETYATNIMGTVHTLEAARTTPSVRSVVVVTSDKCYENREWAQGYKEDDAMGGFDPYSSSKGAAELVTSAYRRSFFGKDGSASIASARAGNVIGGGDWSEDRLIPDIVRGISGGEPIVIRRPESIRPWQHVLEPLSGYLLLGQRLFTDGARYAAAWNFGPALEDCRTVADIADRTCNIWGKGRAIMQPEANAPHEATYLRLDCTKTQEQLGWKPCLRVEQALEWTVNWYKTFYETGSATTRKLTEGQISDYMRCQE